MEDEIEVKPDYDVVVKGRFTIVETHKDGICGIGIARRSQNDEVNPTLGVAIALGRAKKSIQLKAQNKKLRNHYMG